MNFDEWFSAWEQATIKYKFTFTPEHKDYLIAAYKAGYEAGKTENKERVEPQYGEYQDKALKLTKPLTAQRLAEIILEAHGKWIASTEFTHFHQVLAIELEKE